MREPVLLQSGREDVVNQIVLQRTGG